MSTESLVTKELERMNEEREDGARHQVRTILNEIVKHQAQIKAAQKRVKELQEMLTKVSYEPLNAAEVLGS